MIIKPTELTDARLIELSRVEDDRGFFARTYCKSEFCAAGFGFDIVQSNISYNRETGTVRGMHLQLAPDAEDKYVTCTQGAVFDVIVDVRPESSTYLQWQGFELTAQNRRHLYIPKGFAHGFQTLAEHSLLSYQVSAPYAPQAERGYRWDDSAFGIVWPLPVSVISDKDQAHAPFGAVE